MPLPVLPASHNILAFFLSKGSSYVLVLNVKIVVF